MWSSTTNNSRVAVPVRKDNRTNFCLCVRVQYFGNNQTLNRFKTNVTQLIIIFENRSHQKTAVLFFYLLVIYCNKTGEKLTYPFFSLHRQWQRGTSESRCTHIHVGQAILSFLIPINLEYCEVFYKIYLKVANIFLAWLQTADDQREGRVEVLHQLTRHLLQLYTYVHAGPEPLQLHPHRVVQTLKLAPVQLKHQVLLC